MTPSLVYLILAHTLCSPAGISGPIGKPSAGQDQRTLQPSLQLELQ